jgi:hypothetical protein
MERWFDSEPEDDQAMTTKRQTARYKRIERQIADMRELAFGRPKDSPLSDANYLEVDRESIVRVRVLLDCALVEEISARSSVAERYNSFTRAVSV